MWILGLLVFLPLLTAGLLVFTGGQASGCGGESVSCCYCDVVPFRDIYLFWK